jgi:hypothetical protein
MNGVDVEHGRSCISRDLFLLRMVMALVESRVSGLGGLLKFFFEVVIAGVFLPGTEKIAAIAVGIPIVTYYGKAAMKSGLERLPDADLQSLGEASLVDVPLPLVNGLGDSNSFDDLWVLRLSAEHTGNARRAQPPLRV